MKNPNYMSLLWRHMCALVFFYHLPTPLLLPERYKHVQQQKLHKCQTSTFHFFITHFKFQLLCGRNSHQIWKCNQCPGQQPTSFFCRKHSETCLQMKSMFKWTGTICWKMKQWCLALEQVSLLNVFIFLVTCSDGEIVGKILYWLPAFYVHIT